MRRAPSRADERAFVRALQNRVAPEGIGVAGAPSGGMDEKFAQAGVAAPNK